MLLISWSCLRLWNTDSNSLFFPREGPVERDKEHDWQVKSLQVYKLSCHIISLALKISCVRHRNSPPLTMGETESQRCLQGASVQGQTWWPFHSTCCCSELGSPQGSRTPSAHLLSSMHLPDGRSVCLPRGEARAGAAAALFPLPLKHCRVMTWAGSGVGEDSREDRGWGVRQE